LVKPPRLGRGHRGGSSPLSPIRELDGKRYLGNKALTKQLAHPTEGVRLVEDTVLKTAEAKSLHRFESCTFRLRAAEFELSMF
jgi:hypothetical protein